MTWMIVVSTMTTKAIKQRAATGNPIFGFLSSEGWVDMRNSQIMGIGFWREEI
ncbi:hypothetical protein [Planomonospora parontospora]|uniref:hypothetical protein n=1 Tax=Planomonospora parontospora TaxID=58119 RepID=UPI00177F3A19|nr:hypothetical protein [Planomonospora parontospora]